MDCVLLFGTPADADRLGLEGYRLLPSTSVGVLARRLVAEPGILALLLLAGGPPELPEELLKSVQTSFPRLPVLTLPRRPSAEELDTLRRRLASLQPLERRGHRRCDWPLQGCLQLEGREEGPYNLRALSSSGAFLERPTGCPPSEARGKLRVLFQNFTLTTDCLVMDCRRFSSNLPLGFGVRFLGLAPETEALLDRIVQDALVRSLLEPGSSPELPSLDPEELLPDGLELR